jgi:hypothetical protein
MRMDFDGRFAYKGCDAQPGKSSEGEQNGQEIEESEKDRADQAADEEVGMSFMVWNARKRFAGRTQEQVEP